MADKKPSLTSRKVRMTFCSTWEQMLFTEEERAVAQLFAVTLELRIELQTKAGSSSNEVIKLHRALRHTIRSTR